MTFKITLSFIYEVQKLFITQTLALGINSRCGVWGRGTHENLRSVIISMNFPFDNQWTIHILVLLIHWRPNI
jgi:hypothetical protein